MLQISLDSYANFAFLAGDVIVLVALIIAVCRKDKG